MQISKDARFIIIDDQAVVRMAVRTHLKEIGFNGEILMAEDGDVALKIMEDLFSQGKEIDMIICDLAMPNVDGFKVLEHVRGDSRYEKIPFIMLTAESEINTVMKVIDLGATNYIVKPWSLQTLQRKLAESWIKVERKIKNKEKKEEAIRENEKRKSNDFIDLKSNRESALSETKFKALILSEGNPLIANQNTNLKNQKTDPYLDKLKKSLLEGNLEDVKNAKLEENLSDDIGDIEWEGEDITQAAINVSKFLGISEAHPISNTVCKIKWKKVDGPQSYLIFKKVHNILDLVGNTNANADFYFIRNLAPGESYEFLVRQIDQSGITDKNEVTLKVKMPKKSPQDYSELGIWYCAAELDAAEGEKIHNWPDLSSNKNHAIFIDKNNVKPPELTFESFNGLPSLKFRGRGQLISEDIITNIDSSFTFFIVCKLHSQIGDYSRILGPYSKDGVGINDLFLASELNDGNLGIYQKENRSTGKSLPEGEHLLTFELNENGQGRVWRNGRPFGDAFSYQATPLLHIVISGLNFKERAAQFFQGDLAEIIVYKRTLDEVELKELNSQLMERWRL
ncbi:MAG: response regulator [Halobacteriovoraceae bacterium]|nr:response regulator [Halobacteriovoraceae bacterium]